ncbi:MAG: hypothetical protein GQ507_03650 [Dehalococcoidales bacterium]|nr:hypothetical protein [Dehalococcoidales bacterium]
MVHEVEKNEEETTNVTGVYVWPFIDYIRIAKLDSDAVLPDRKHLGDAGLDFYALNPVVVKPHEVKVIRTGITMELPPHYFGLIKPKGGSNFDVLSGVVDPNYQGEILIKVYNPSDDAISFLGGQAVAQVVFIPIIRPDLKLVAENEIHKTETYRGETGGIVKYVE